MEHLRTNPRPPFPRGDVKPSGLTGGVRTTGASRAARGTRSGTASRNSGRTDSRLPGKEQRLVNAAKVAKGFYHPPPEINVILNTDKAYSPQSFSQ